MKKLIKIFSVIEKKIIQTLLYIDSSLYMKLYVKYLKKQGMNIQGKPNYIGVDVYFDGVDYSVITLSENVTISREVMFLTHDYSMSTVYRDLKISNVGTDLSKDLKENFLLLNGISIGRNSFIGARSSILPGTKIGENVLIGACSVVKGTIPDNSIVIGNPAKVIGKTSDWISKKIEKQKGEYEI